MKVLAWLGLLVAMVPLPASSQQPLQTPLPTASPSPTSQAAEPYRVGAGDLLHVVTYQHDEISGDFKVEDDGDITFPLLGRVPVAGLTPAAVGSRLEALLEKDYYVDVQLQVEVKEYHSRPVTVTGEVNQPGTYYLSGTTSLTQLLAEAGGVKDTAGSVVKLRRNERVGDEPQQRVWTLPLAETLSSGGPELEAGDVVTVPAKQLFFVTGEVARPGQYELSEGLTLMQALTQAGGLDKFASQNVELHRDDDGHKQILKYDLARIRKGKNPDPPIQAGDVVIVKRRFF